MPPAGQPSMPPAGPYPAATSPAIPVRPFGILVLTLVEIAIGIVGLVTAIDLFQWANWAADYGSVLEVVEDAALGVAYLATSVAVFDLARSVWSMQQWAWKRACLLSLILIGLIVVSIFLWGVETMDLVGLTVHASVLVYLSLASTRAIFGRSPTTVTQGQG